MLLVAVVYPREVPGYALTVLWCSTWRSEHRILIRRSTCRHMVVPNWLLATVVKAW